MHRHTSRTIGHTPIENETPISPAELQQVRDALQRRRDAVETLPKLPVSTRLVEFIARGLR